MEDVKPLCRRHPGARGDPFGKSARPYSYGLISLIEVYTIKMEYLEMAIRPSHGKPQKGLPKVRWISALSSPASDSRFQPNSSRTGPMGDRYRTPRPAP